MYLHEDKKDIYGMPIICADCDFRENEQSMVEDMMITAAEILEEGGVKDIETFNNNQLPGSCIHETALPGWGTIRKHQC